MKCKNIDFQDKFNECHIIKIVLCFVCLNLTWFIYLSQNLKETWEKEIIFLILFIGPLVMCNDRLPLFLLRNFIKVLSGCFVCLVIFWFLKFCSRILIIFYFKYILMKLIKNFTRTFFHNIFFWRLITTLGFE